MTFSFNVNTKNLSATATKQVVAVDAPAVDPLVEIAVEEVEDIPVDIDLEEAVEREQVAEEEPLVEP